MEKMAIADVTNVCDANIADIDSGSTNRGEGKTFRYFFAPLCPLCPMQILAGRICAAVDGDLCDSHA